MKRDCLIAVSPAPTFWIRPTRKKKGGSLRSALGVVPQSLCDLGNGLETGESMKTIDLIVGFLRPVFCLVFILKPE